jgi:hypothetical protein
VIRKGERLRRGIDDRSRGTCGQGVRESDWLRGGKRELGSWESWKYKTGGSKGKRESLEGLIMLRMGGRNYGRREPWNTKTLIRNNFFTDCRIFK